MSCMPPFEFEFGVGRCESPKQEASKATPGQRIAGRSKVGLEVGFVLSRTVAEVGAVVGEAVGTSTAAATAHLVGRKPGSVVPPTLVVVGVVCVAAIVVTVSRAVVGVL